MESSSAGTGMSTTSRVSGLQVHQKSQVFTHQSHGRRDAPYGVYGDASAREPSREPSCTMVEAQTMNTTVMDTF